MMRSLSLLLLVALAALVENEEGGKHHSRPKREFLSRSKRRWVLSTIELEEEMNVKYPFKLSQMFNDKTAGKQFEFDIKGEGVNEGLFSIDKVTGDVYAHAPVDREKKASYHITFDVWDKLTNEKIDRELAFDVEVKDINDNAPRFTAITKEASVKENTPSGEYLPASMEAVDDDQEGTVNSTVVITVDKQFPAEPKIGIAQISGRLHRLIFDGCFDYDKEKIYSILIKASDRGNPPLSSTATIKLNVIDTNSHQPTFKQRQYNAEAMEMTTLETLLRVAVEDKDTPNTDGWRAKYFFISGNEDGLYKITTDPKTNEGVISIVKEKNFEVHTLVKLRIGVENVEPISVCKDGKLITNSKKVPPPDSVNITVKMIDTNDAPVFEKYTDDVYQMEESEPGQVLYNPNVHDIDSSKFRFKLIEDPANWVTVDEKTGKITTIKKMDRESSFVENDIYRIAIAAIDDGSPPATSTCTIKVHLGDINDNIPILVNKTVIMCVNNVDKILVRAQDADAEPYSGPFIFFMGDDKTASKLWKLDPAYGEEVGLVSLETLPYGNYSVPLVIQDMQNEAAVETLNVEVCECNKSGVCRARKPLSIDLGGAAIGLIFAGLLLFLILLLLFTCNTRKDPLFVDFDEGHQTLVKYNHEGGGVECKDNIHIPVRYKSVTDSLQQDNVQNTEAASEMSNVKDLHSPRGSENDTYDICSAANRKYFEWKTEEMAEMPTSATADHPLVYEVEGEIGSCPSMEALSFSSEKDFSFPDTLTPQFSTLGMICSAHLDQLQQIVESAYDITLVSDAPSVLGVFGAMGWPPGGPRTLSFGPVIGDCLREATPGP
ncbi:hypothetical protein CRENBAI_006297 [Crenichthys baileyi]|uniref:Cadherin domain-containing protein n=1 Tax=Crenichthys baileyi TaxID=28760 RepID=A0AAV9RS92_9TELE